MDLKTSLGGGLDNISMKFKESILIFFFVVGGTLAQTCWQNLLGWNSLVGKTLRLMICLILPGKNYCKLLTLNELSQGLMLLVQSKVHL